MDEESAVEVCDHIAEPSERRVLAMTMIGDFHRDWRRWSVVERVCAAALAGLWASGMTTALLVYVQLR